MRSGYQLGYGTSMNPAQQHLHEETANFPLHQPHFSIMNYGQPKNSKEFINGPRMMIAMTGLKPIIYGDVETYLSTPKSPAENASGHQFLQPRVSSGSATRR